MMGATGHGQVRYLPLAILASGVLLRPQPLLAQDRVEVGPLVGFFAPTTTFAGPLRMVPGSNNYTLNIAIAVGAEANIWLTPRVGLGALIGWSPSAVRQESATLADTSLSAPVQLFGMFLALKFNLSHLNGDVRARAGAGYLRHMGAAFAPYGHPGSLTGLVGIEATLPLRRALRLTGGLDAYLYSLQLTDTFGTRYEHRFQADLLARVGLMWVPGAHRVGALMTSVARMP